MITFFAIFLLLRQIDFCKKSLIFFKILGIDGSDQEMETGTCTHQGCHGIHGVVVDEGGRI